MANAFTLFGELQADTGAFKKSLLDAEKRLKSTEKEIAKAEKEAKSFGDTSAKTARQHQKLNERLDDSRKKLKDAAEAFEKGDISAKRMASAMTQVDRAGLGVNRRLKDMAARLSDVAAKATATKALAGFGRSLQNIGGNIKQVGQSLLPVTFGIGAFAVAAAKSADTIFQLENKLTASTGSFQKANKVLNDYIRLSRQSVGVTADFAVEVDSLFRPMKGVSEEVLPDLIKAFGKLKTANQSINVGDLGLNLAQLFNEGFEKADFKQLFTSFPRIGQILAEQFGGDGTLEGMQKVFQGLKKNGELTMGSFLQGFADAVNKDQALGKLKDGFFARLRKETLPAQQALAPLGKEIMNVLKPALAALPGIIKTVSDAFISLPQPIKTAIVVIAGLAAVIPPVIIAVGALVAASGAIAGAVAAVAGFVSAAGGLTVVAPILAAIGVVMAVVAAGAIALYAAWQTNFGGIRDLAQTVADAVQTAWGKAMDFLKEQIGSALDAVSQFWNENGEDIKRAVSTLSEWLKSTTKGYLKALENFWDQNGENIIGILETAWETIKDVFKAGFQIISGVVKLIVAVINGDFNKAADQMVEIMSGAFNMIVSVFSGIGQLMFQIGAAIISGLIRGLRSKIDDLRAQMGIVETIIRSIQGALRIASPSKVMIDIGQDIIEGLIVGIKSKNKKLQSTIENLTGQLVDAFRSLGLIREETFAETISRLFGDERLTAQIEKFAAALGMTAEQLRKVVAVKMKRDSAFASIAAMTGINPTPEGGRSGRGIGTGTSIVGAPSSSDAPPSLIMAPPPALIEKWQSFFDLLKERFTSFKQSLPDLKTAITVNLIDSLDLMSSSLANALTNWEGGFKGFLSGLLNALRDTVRQILTELARIAIAKAVAQIAGSLVGSLGGGGGGFGGVLHEGGHLGGFTAPAGGAGGFGSFAPPAGAFAGAAAGGSTTNVSNSFAPVINMQGSGNPQQDKRTASMIKREVIMAMRDEQRRNR